MHHLFLRISLWLLLPVVLLVTSCRHNDSTVFLAMANSLCQDYPDSAYHLLLEKKEMMENSSRSTKMYYQLLLIKASDKADKMKPDEQKMLKLVDYFAHHDNEHYPEALYYAGRTYREMEDSPSARDYFIRTIEAVGKHHYSSSDNYFKGKAYSQLGSLYLYQEMYREAASMYGNSYEVSKLMNDTTGMAFNLRDLSNAYYCMGMPQKSMDYANKALKITKDKASYYKKMRWELEAMLAAGAYTNHDFKLAGQLLERLFKVKDNPQILLEASSTAAPYYFDIGEDERSRQACQYLLAHGNLFDKQKAARILSLMAMKKEQHNEASHYLQQYYRLSDSLSVQRKTETLMRLNSLYNYNSKVKENLKLKSQRTTFLWGMILFVVLCLGLGITFAVYMRYSRQRQQLLNMKLAHYQDLIRRKKELNQVTKEKDLNLLTESEVYRKIRRSLNTPNESKVMDDEDWKRLGDLLEQINPKFHERLFNLCKLSENEYHVSLLVKAGFPPSAIAILTCHSKESVTATRRRLYEKAFGKKGTPKDWDEIIISL